MASSPKICLFFLIFQFILTNEYVYGQFRDSSIFFLTLFLKILNNLFDQKKAAPIQSDMCY